MNNEKTMKVWKFGHEETANYVGEGIVTKIVPAARAARDWKRNCYETEYWKSREECERALAEEKAKQAAIARECEAVLAKDPALAERMANHACTQEDNKLPHYNEFSQANRKLDLARWVAGFVVCEWMHSAIVSRLNTLPDEDNEYGEEMRNEIADVMAYYGECEVWWSCLGHTRAEMQTSAVCRWVRATHPEWHVESKGSFCVITRK